MKSQTRRHKLFETLLLTVFGVVMYVSQVIMSSLPNIEIVSFLIILTTCFFGVKAICSVYIFVVCEILTYGIQIWVINYLYVWAVLWLVILFFRKNDSSLFYAVISGIYGLMFGALCSVPYFFMEGIPGAIGYITAGMLFDIIHCVGNFVLTFILYKPLKNALEKILNRF